MYGKEVKIDQIEKSKELLSSSVLLDAMFEVIDKWPVSTKHNFTNAGSNRRSWLGQAACCIRHKSTEFETRLAWRELTSEVQKIANSYADQVILNWEQLNNFNRKSYVKEILR